MKKRGYKLGKQRKDEYVNLLMEHAPKYTYSSEKLLHKLMLFALIEARSCERFRLLHENLEEEELRNFYYKFMISEAGHYRMFIDLAMLYYPAEQVKQTWQDWLNLEIKILAMLTPAADRMH